MELISINNTSDATVGPDNSIAFGVGLVQPSAVQASLYRLQFGNPEISPTGFHFHHFST
jgi:hypothetical protein